MKNILNIDHTWKTSLQARTCLTPNSVFITSLEDVQLKNIFQKTTLRTLLITGNGNLTLLSLLPKLATLSKILHNRQMETSPSQRNPPHPPSRSVFFSQIPPGTLKRILLKSSPLQSKLFSQAINYYTVHRSATWSPNHHHGCGQLLHHVFHTAHLSKQPGPPHSFKALTSLPGTSAMIKTNITYVEGKKKRDPKEEGVYN